MAEAEKPRVLIVEDEMIVGAFLQLFLERNGFEVSDIYASGEHAVEAARIFKPDVVLMDIHLAGRMTGVEAAEAIGSFWKTCIVFISAHSRQYRGHQIPGCRIETLDKPFDEKVMLQLLIQLLGERG